MFKSVTSDTESILAVTHYGTVRKTSLVLPAYSQASVSAAWLQSGDGVRIIALLAGQMVLAAGRTALAAVKSGFPDVARLMSLYTAAMVVMLPRAPAV